MVRRQTQGITLSEGFRYKAMQAALMFTAESKVCTTEEEGETSVKILMGTKQGKRGKGLTKQWKNCNNRQKHPADSSHII